MTENVELSPLGETIRCRDTHGRAVEWRVLAAQPPTTAPGGLLSSRVTLATTGNVVKRWVPPKLARHDSAAYEELEHEVLAGLRLLDRYSGGPYPEELVRLIGYDLDDGQPFVVLSAVRGQPVDELGQFRPGAREAFETSLLRGLLFLGEARVEHNALYASSVHWDGSTVQIRDFGHATVVSRSNTGPGTRDIPAAGVLIQRVATGRTGPFGPAALDGQGQALRDLLDGVFSDVPAHRPTPAVLLSRLNEPAPRLREDLHAWMRFEEGRIRFDEAMREKYPPRPAPTPLTVEPSRLSTTRQRWIAGISLLIVVAAAVAVVWFR
jgi:hypothetical protein